MNWLIDYYKFEKLFLGCKDRISYRGQYCSIHCKYFRRYDGSDENRKCMLFQSWLYSDYKRTEDCLKIFGGEDGIVDRAL